MAQEDEPRSQSEPDAGDQPPGVEETPPADAQNPPNGGQASPSDGQQVPPGISHLQQKVEPEDPAKVFLRNALGVAILAAGLTLLYMLWAIWPIKIAEETSAAGDAATCLCGAVPSSTPGPSPLLSAAKGLPAVSATQTPSPSPSPMPSGPLAYDSHVFLFGQSFTMSLEVRLMWIVGLAAALGSFIQVATSFSTFVGNRSFDAAWIWWYVLRVPIGMGLAYVFYFAVRGGFLSTSSVSSDVSAFGIAAISGLVGLFSKQASDKLEETFKTLFRVASGAGDDQRAGKLHFKPRITSLDPRSIAASKAPVPPILITGTGFDEKCKVQVDGVTRNDAVYRNATTLAFTLAPEDLVAGKTYLITVTNTAPGGGTSDPTSLQITQ